MGTTLARKRYREIQNSEGLDVGGGKKVKIHMACVAAVIEDLMEDGVQTHHSL